MNGDKPQLHSSPSTQMHILARNAFNNALLLHPYGRQCNRSSLLVSSSFHIKDRLLGNALSRIHQRTLVSSAASASSAAQRDFYDVLGVDRKADKKTIKKKYFELAKKYHPDQNPNNPEATKKFQEVSQAYEVLSDDEKRQQYDQFGHSGVQDDANAQNAQAQNARAEELFRRMMKDMFGGGGPGGMFGGGNPFFQDRATPEASDLTYTMRITFEEAVRGAVKEVEYVTMKTCEPCHGTGASDGRARNTACPTCQGSGYRVRTQRTPLGIMQFQTVCDTCHGEGKTLNNPCGHCKGEGRTRGTVDGKINVPAGIATGQTIRVVRGGEAGIRGAKAGDLLVTFEVEEPKDFVRNGASVSSEVKIPLITALIGGSVPVKGVLGEVFEVKVAGGTNTGDKSRLRNKGIPVVNGGGARGDHVIEFVVDMPKKLTSRQRELLDEFQAEEDKKNGTFRSNRTTTSSTASSGTTTSSNSNEEPSTGIIGSVIRGASNVLGRLFGSKP